MVKMDVLLDLHYAMTKFDSSQIEWRKPWLSISTEHALQAEAVLQREMGAGHVLFGRLVNAVGFRQDLKKLILFRNPYFATYFHKKMDEQSLASVNWFPVRLPRLYDLYDRSDKTHPDNYFANFPARRAEILFEKIFKQWEETLRALDPKAWEQLTEKTLDSGTKKHPRRQYAQLFDFLNEARGYALLVDRGYDQISFIDCKCRQKKKSPDLLGESQNSTAILEVKTIDISDKELDWRERDQFQTRTVIGLSDKFREKVCSTIDHARKQLDAYSKSVDKKIVLLLVRFDMDNILEARNYSALQNLIATNQISGLEIVHEVI